MGLGIYKTKKGFRAAFETYTPERKTITVEPTEYHAYGLKADMTFDEASRAAKSFRNKNKLERHKTQVGLKIQRSKKSIDTIYLPSNLTEAFVAELEIMYKNNQERLDTVLQHWRSAQNIIEKIQQTPDKFFESRFFIYSYFKDKAWSPDYMKRITKILNQWGGFYGRKTGKYFEEIPRISGSWKEEVLDAREDRDNVRLPAAPLEWRHLQNSETKFRTAGLQEKWNWLYVAFQFGLRPSEVDSLKNSKNFKIEHDRLNKVSVLRVYQSKLKMLSKDYRWKTIPIHSKHQQKAIEFIKSGQFDRPLTKTIKRIIGDQYDTYSPRKGFTDMMLNEGWELEDISVFMGHSSIETTWRHYKNKMTFKMPKKAA
jgi:integrase